MWKQIYLSGLLLASACGSENVRAGGPADLQTPFTAPVAAPADVAALVQSGNRFSAQLFLHEGQAEGNVVLSPVSIAGAFALLQPGARGETADDLAKVLGFDAVAEGAFADTMGALLADVETHVAPLPAPKRPPEKGSDAYWKMVSDPAVDFSVANAAWVKQGFELQPPYTATLARAFNAQPYAVDFSSSEAAAAQINTWVASKTNNRIKDLISPQMINPADTRLILTNAVWFKARWHDAFDADATQDGDFFGRGDAAMPARLMRRVGRMPYLKGDGFAAVQLAYTHPDFALNVILPDARGGMPELQARLGADGLTAALAGLDTAASREVDLTLPKVSVNGRFDLVPGLKALGAGRAFDPARADFSGLMKTPEPLPEPLFVSDVVHVTWFQMDETTTEAAAATAIAVATEAANISDLPTVFKVDHPFLIALTHKPTGMILFIGRIEAV
jgi:serpin B